jgi:hypothetical protein
MPRIKDLIIDSFLCVRDKMNPNERKGSFELFGFDFLLDEDFRIWLIEINHNPYIGTPNAYMKTLVPRMIDDMLKIVLDPYLKPRQTPNPDEENGFELLYREERAGVGPAVNVRRPFSLDLIYPIPELKPFIGKKSNLKNKPGIAVKTLQRHQTDMMAQKSPSKQGEEGKDSLPATPKDAKPN